MTTKELTCIGCPMGCLLTATLDDDGKFISVDGYTCAIGKKYGEEECTNPTRMVTALAHAVGSQMPVSVKTNKPIEKGKIFDCLAEIAKIDVKLPVHIGDVIISNVCGTDVNIVATKEIS
jgi:CxxC motif-containing protein